MGAWYGPAPEVAEVATNLIDAYHPELVDAPIVYVLRSPAPVSKGRVQLGKARLVSGLNGFLANLAGGVPGGHPEFGHDLFCMEISAEYWELFDDTERAALVDHELCHFSILEDDDGNRGLAILGHDVEEFIAVAARHGAWSRSLKTLVETCGAH